MMESESPTPGPGVVEPSHHHGIQIIPISELEELETGGEEPETIVINLPNEVYCLFCYAPVRDYKVDRVYKRVLRKTCQRMFFYVCDHLDIKVPDDHPRRKIPDKPSREARLHPGNLPLCHPCRGLYYNEIYETFVAYESVMVKLADKISDCITKAIAISAKENKLSTAELSEAMDSFQNYINEHEVMASVRKFRQKVLEKNPMGYREGERVAQNTIPVVSPQPIPISTPSTSLTTQEAVAAVAMGEARVQESNNLIPDEVIEEESAVSETNEIDLDMKPELSVSKTPTYYAVRNPAPGVIQIIPVVVNTSNLETRTDLGTTTAKRCRTQQFAVIESYDNDNNIQERKVRIVSKRESKKQSARLNTCKFCNKPFTSQIALVDHEVKVHGKEKPEKCPKCEYRCINKTSLRSHMQTHLDETEKLKPFECSQCDAKFRFKRGLESHLRSHRGEKPYICEVCRKAFSCRESMKLCIDKHNGVKNHECKYCPKRFLRKEVLDIHLRTHTGERPFTCQICNKKFAQRAPMRAHLKMHAKKNPCAVTNKPKKK